MTENHAASSDGLHGIILKVERAFSGLTVAATFMCVYAWLFVLATALLGRKHWGWLIVGPLLVVPVLAIGFTLFDARREFLSLPWVRSALRIIATVRNLIAAGVLLGLARYLWALTDEEDITAAQVMEGAWRLIISG